MTTGTTYRNSYYNVSLNAGPTWVGVKWVKNWNGADRPASTPSSAMVPVLKGGRVRYRIKFRPEKVVTRVSKRRTVLTRSYYTVKVPGPTIRRPNRKGKGTHEVKTFVRERRSKLVPREVGGKTYYKILKEQSWLISKKSRSFLVYKKAKLPRESWGEHAYQMQLDIEQQNQSVFMTRDYGFNPPKWLGPYSCTATSMAGLPLMTFNWSNNDVLALIGRLRQALLGSQFHAGKFLIESGEALNTIANVAERVTHSYLFAKRGNWKAAFNTIVDAQTARSRNGKAGKSARKSTSEFSVAQTAANNWLQWSYGLSPLLSDAKGAAEALAHYQSVPRRQRTVVSLLGSAKVTSSSPSVYEWDAFAYIGAKLIAIHAETNLPALTGLTDWQSALWERTPWSFVADWFIPIGDYLEARGTAQAVSGTFILTTRKHVHIGGVRSIHPDLSFGAGYYGLHLNINRDVMTELAVPTPQFKPLNEVMSSWKRAANAVSLLTQQLRR